MESYVDLRTNGAECSRAVVMGMQLVDIVITTPAHQRRRAEYLQQSHTRTNTIIYNAL